jgi:4-amino-4-deoxy-L-arabinose transferase-like glycosyltransferase
MRLRETLARGEVRLLAAVLLVALALRTWGAFFGLPHVYHPDEGFEVYRAVRLGMGGFDTGRIAKGGYYFLLFLEYGCLFVWSLVTGAVGGAGDFARSFVRDPSPFWMIGRVTTAVLGTGTVALVWWQGRRMGSTRAGLLGALFLALSFQHVEDSHYITVDVPMALFAFWAVILVVEDASGRSRLRARTFAPIAAFAALCKMPAILVLAPFLLAAFLRGGFRGPDGVFSRRTILPAAATLAIYVAANPGLLLGFRGFVQEAGGLFVRSGSSAAESAAEGASTNLWLFYARALLRSQGPALLVLSLLGAVIGVARRSQAAILHLAFVVPLFVLIAAASTSHLYYPRYVVPMLPGLCLLAGLALDDLVRRIQPATRASGALAAAIACLIVIEPGLSAATWDMRLTRKDTRTLAAEWIEAHVEHRARILLEGFPEETAQLSIPLRDTKENVGAMIERLRATDPGKALFWELKVGMQEAPLYDLVTVRHEEPWGALDGYLDAGVEWVVVRRESFVEAIDDARQGGEIASSRHRFYVDLVADARAERAAFFPASEWGAPGYDIEIWKLAPLAGARTLAGADTANQAG